MTSMLGGMQVKGRARGDVGWITFESIPVPKKLTVVATDLAVPYDVEIEAVLENGRMVPRSISCRAKKGAEVTSEGLRRIPVATILRLGILSFPGVMSPLVGKDLSAVRAAGPTDESLRLVAASYRLAYLAGAPPTAAVADHFDLPRSTAARWVQLARRRGFLRPAEERKAGEQTRSRRRASSPR